VARQISSIIQGVYGERDFGRNVIKTEQIKTVATILTENTDTILAGLAFVFEGHKRRHNIIVPASWGTA
jgi:hypothetical protein